jgi:hypothetical protein
MLATVSATGSEGKDGVLFLMERGMMRQCAGDYEGSIEDFVRAAQLIEDLETYSVSKGGASMVINDSVQSYRGRPYERALLHAFAAQSHMALGHWNDSAVEARRILESLNPERRGKHPDVAYSRYVAGFCLALTDDPSNAEIQYRLASELVPGVELETRSGRFLAADPAAPKPGEPWSNELVCFVAMGRAQPDWAYNAGPEGFEQPSAYAEFFHQGRYLGRSYTLNDTAALAAAAERADAARRATKTGARIALKEGIARAVEHNTDGNGWGDLTRLILIGLLEQPDTRSWGTLPRWLQVARVPCPPDLKEYDVVFKNAAGHTTMSASVTGPIQKHRNMYVSMCRDLRVSVSRDR